MTSLISSLFQMIWFILIALLYLLSGVCQAIVNTEEAVPSPGLPSIVTAVTPVTLAPPAITVSRFMVYPQRMYKIQEYQHYLQDVVSMGWALFIHSFTMYSWDDTICKTLWWAWRIHGYKPYFHGIYVCKEDRQEIGNIEVEARQGIIGAQRQGIKSTALSWWAELCCDKQPYISVA